MILDFFFEIVDVATGDDDDDDESNSDWLYDLQEPGGERFTSYIFWNDSYYIQTRLSVPVFENVVIFCRILWLRPLQPKSLPQQWSVQE